MSLTTIQAYSLLKMMVNDSHSSSKNAHVTAEEIASSKYLALSAAGALLHYIGTLHMGYRIVPGSIVLKLLHLENYLQLDRQTTAALEIVKSQRPPPGPHLSMLLFLLFPCQ